ncbi:uncharacterized protein LOC121640325 [Melanotaenia boesemani]|uniref:uncharacterized protein LOC121640325 n=1 Tax=Melanotaenia boesemani TaxID=1250792 RepID=UPI001C05277F|nr:uncharacterized protein LOC121640325 [Melanotaenia boesemani]
MINNKWCDSKNIVTLKQSCSPNLELLTLKCRPYYLPREFTSVIISAVYIPPQADTNAALTELHEAISTLQASQRKAAFIVAGDFNSANMTKVMPEFTQHINCPTRGERTLDHCYSPFKEGYKAKPLPPFGKSDHTAVLLMPKYKQKLKQELAVVRKATRWTDQSEATLQGALESADWDMFRSSAGGDIEEFTEAVMGFIGKLVEDTTPKRIIRAFPNQKPWVDKSIRDVLRSRTAAYNSGLATGNMEEYKAASYNVRRAVKEAKQRYGRRLEHQMEHPRPPQDPLPCGHWWVHSFLTGRPQVVRLGHHSSSPLTLSTGSPQGCVLSPLLYSLYTHDCEATSDSNVIIKFADDTAVVGLISHNDETDYRREVSHLEVWCQENHLLLNVSKTKELIVDFRKQQRSLHPLLISGSEVERVDTFRYLGVTISQDLTWTQHITTTVKKARQRLYLLRRLRDFKLPLRVLKNFYSCTIESILCGSITTWMGNCPKQDLLALKRVVRAAEWTTRTTLPNLQDIYEERCRSRAKRILSQPSHPAHSLFSPLPSGRRFRCLRTKTERLKKSFFPLAVRLLNSEH